MKLTTKHTTHHSNSKSISTSVNIQSVFFRNMMEKSEGFKMLAGKNYNTLSKYVNDVNSSIGSILSNDRQKSEALKYIKKYRKERSKSKNRQRLCQPTQTESSSMNNSMIATQYQYYLTNRGSRKQTGSPQYDIGPILTDEDRNNNYLSEPKKEIIYDNLQTIENLQTYDEPVTSTRGNNGGIEGYYINFTNKKTIPVIHKKVASNLSKKSSKSIGNGNGVSFITIPTQSSNGLQMETLGQLSLSTERKNKTERSNFYSSLSISNFCVDFETKISKLKKEITKHQDKRVDFRNSYTSFSIISEKPSAMEDNDSSEMGQRSHLTSMNLVPVEVQSEPQTIEKVKIKPMIVKRKDEYIKDLMKASLNKVISIQKFFKKKKRDKFSGIIIKEMYCGYAVREYRCEFGLEDKNIREINKCLENDRIRINRNYVQFVDKTKKPAPIIEQKIVRKKEVGTNTEHFVDQTVTLNSDMENVIVIENEENHPREKLGRDVTPIVLLKKEVPEGEAVEEEEEVSEQSEIKNLMENLKDKAYESKMNSEYLKKHLDLREKFKPFEEIKEVTEKESNTTPRDAKDFDVPLMVKIMENKVISTVKKHKPKPTAFKEEATKSSEFEAREKMEEARLRQRGNDLRRKLKSARKKNN